MAKFCIDAGHNYSGVDTGAVGKVFKEQELTFQIADRLRVILERAGHMVKMTRQTLTSNVSASTVAESLRERARISNVFNADYFISIHLNAGGGVGTETYILARGGEAERIAQRVQDAFKALGRVDRGVKANNLAVLRLTDAPAILVEAGFIDNEQEEEWVSQNVDAIARAIASAYDVEGETEYMSSTEAIAYLNSIGIISEPDKWYAGTWNDDDFKWLIRKTAQYIKDNA